MTHAGQPGEPAVVGHVEFVGELVQDRQYTRVHLPRAATVGLEGRHLPARISAGEAVAEVTLHRSGDSYSVALSSAFRAAAGGSGAGALLHLAVDILDAAPLPGLPEDLAAAVSADPRAAAALPTLSAPHLRELLRWLESAKRESTRRQRVAQIVARIRAL